MTMFSQLDGLFDPFRLYQVTLYHLVDMQIHSGSWLSDVKIETHSAADALYAHDLLCQGIKFVY